VISYHYNFTMFDYHYNYNCTYIQLHIFNNKGVKMVHLGVYCNVDIVDGGMIGE